ncbi:hypothetical protein ACS0TY_007404 [Phlomoides rotata]
MERNVRSVQCRMRDNILKDCKKFNGCVQQIELINPSGANEQVILQRANELLMGQKGYEEGFKYNHVWSILKEYLQTQTETQGVVFSESEENMMGSPNPSLPPFTVNLSDDSSDGSSPSQRPEGVKKSKMKRKLGEEKSMFLQTIKEENEKLWDILQSSNENKVRAFEILERKK